MTRRLERLLVAYGGDKRSDEALALGVQIARASGAEVVIGLVVKTDDPYGQAYPPTGSVSGIIEDQAKGWLADAQASVPDDVRSRTVLRHHESVATALLEIVEETGAELVVTGSGTGLGRVRVHPVVEQLLHSSPVPLVLAPRRYRPDAGLRVILGAVSPQLEGQVVSTAARWGRDLGIPFGLLTFAGAEGDDGALASRLRAATDEAAAQAGAAQAEASVGTVAVQTADPLIGSAPSLKKAVRKTDWPEGSVLVVGSSRLAQHRRIFLGSTAARILAHLPVPMVVLPRDAKHGSR
ncbi:universal stress protein [Arthrobacter sp. UM1]|uniref:universal stress protein n=1 Tax=Arthrobacter sp. UM1 TaxID=2766776 RepID=UPI001CF701A1|nr:universal stress protein [Arthrobacter sp. UM1]MCB4209091.1 universal stress protein [Arthrobacter sp. UM1]